MAQPTPDPLRNNAWIVTGPTSGIGYRTALQLAKRGTVVLVGRNRAKLIEVAQEIEKGGGHAESVVCDLSDVTSARRAAAEIVALDLPIAGLLNNAGIMSTRPFQTAQGWDGTFATDHLGPFALTEAIVPHLPDGADVVFICSAVEDPERKPAVIAGFRGARYISAEASARGEWVPGGSKLPGGDAYATSKQCNLATVLAFARETPRLRFNAVEPGFSPGSNLGRDANVPLRFLSKHVGGCGAPVGEARRHTVRAFFDADQSLVVLEPNSRGCGRIVQDPMEVPPVDHLQRRKIGESRQGAEVLAGGCNRSVQAVLRLQQADADQRFDGVGSVLEVDRQFLAFGGGEVTQHIVGRVHPAGRPADPAPDPQVVLGAQRSGDRLEPVVAALAAALLHPDDG